MYMFFVFCFFEFKLCYCWYSGPSFSVPPEFRFFLEKWMVSGSKKRNLGLIVTGSEMLPGLLMWGYLSALLLVFPGKVTFSTLKWPPNLG